MGFALKHLAESDRARIARELFKVTSVEDQKGELHGLCPIHQEKNPSFSYNYRKDIYHCFSCGASGDLVRLWCEVRGFESRKIGFKAFCEAHGPFPSWEGEKSAAGPQDAGGGREFTMAELEDAWARFPPLSEEWITKLERTRGWSRKWIEILDLRLQTFYRQAETGKLVPIDAPERIAIPVRDAAGRLLNIRLYKPGGGDLKIISWGKSYGSARLFPARPLQDADPVLLCEGEPDTICALSHGFNAITQTSKLRKWTKEHLAPFDGREVVIAYDADQAGVKYACHAAESLVRTAKSVRILEWPEWMGFLDGKWPDKRGQDLTDFFVRHGKSAEDLRDLIAAARRYEPPPQAERAGVLQFFERGINDRLSFKPRILAERILADMKLMSEPDTGLLYKWNGRFWEVIHEDYIRMLCLRHLGNEAQKGRVEDAVFQVKILSTIPEGRSVNDRQGVFCVRNGMYDLESDRLYPHAPEFYATYMFPVVYDPERTPICSRWLQFLRETVQTPEVIAQAQEYAGYCLTYKTDYEKCLLLIGPGSDGKSTFLKILRELVGPDNCASVSIQDLEDQFQRSSLYGKLLNISTEVGSKAMESQFFKAIVSGDAINAAFKHKDVFSFAPTCKLAFAANRLPRVLDNSDGFFRRILPIQFKRQFIEDADVGLFETLRGELSGIFHWALVGLARLRENKRFTEADETRRLLMDYRRINNPVLCFIEDECKLGDDYEIAKADLYDEYKAYCGKNGYQGMSRENFFRELYTAVHNLKQFRPRMEGSSRAYKISGITLKSALD